jgi:hypothetical protein
MHSFVEFLESNDTEETTTTTNEPNNNIELSAEQSQLIQFRAHVDSIDLNDDEQQPQQQQQAQTFITAENNHHNHRNARAQCRLQALRLLLFYLKLQAAPNIAHLLLGFDINKPLRNQNFFQPGTKINYAQKSSPTDAVDSEVLTIVPRNCLHSIVRILNRFVREPLVTLAEMPLTVELCYELLYTLCSNVSFNQQLLAYLRHNFDFVCANLRQIPLVIMTVMTVGGGVDASATLPLQDTTNADVTMAGLWRLREANNGGGEGVVQQQNNASGGTTQLHTLYAWIMGLTCIEMQSLIANRQKAALKKLVHLLVMENSVSGGGGGGSGGMQVQETNGRDSPANVSRIFSHSNFDSLLFMNRAGNMINGTSIVLSLLLVVLILYFQKNDLVLTLSL